MKEKVLPNFAVPDGFYGRDLPASNRPLGGGNGPFPVIRGVPVGGKMIRDSH